MHLPLSGFVLLATAAIVGASPFPDTESQKSSRLAVINGLLTVRAAQATACGPVSGANVKGECYDINTTCCLGFYSTGYCPGGKNVRFSSGIR
uniref:Uncharacterized protein n=1 Tax=Moniliophthora roreri TaxID=221103 RepID=A0A0W0GFS6_MONRR